MTTVERRRGFSAAVASKCPTTQKHSGLPLAWFIRQRQDSAFRRGSRPPPKPGSSALRFGKDGETGAAPIRRRPKSRHAASLANIAHLRSRLSRPVGERWEETVRGGPFPPRSPGCRGRLSCLAVSPAQAVLSRRHQRGYCPSARCQVKSRSWNDRDIAQVIPEFIGVKQYPPRGIRVIPAGGCAPCGCCLERAITTSGAKRRNALREFWEITKHP